MRLAILAACLTLPVAAGAAESAYTKTDLDKNCRQVAEDEVGGSWTCKGLGGAQVLFSEGDLRQSIFYGEVGAWYEAGARSTIRALSATGASVVVVSMVHPPEIVDIGPGITMPAVYGDDVDCENRALRRAVDQEPRAHYLDLDAYVCPNGKCRDQIDGVTLRTDGRHFQGPAANIVSPWILRGALTQAGLQPFS